MCVLPGGRFVGGYDPTLPNQHNLGGAKPYKAATDGEELDQPNGSFSGQTLYVPGPYKIAGQTIGSDSPPSPNGVFNNNQTYTGCAIDSRHNVFAERHRDRTGRRIPPPSSGRLVEWFAPTYKTYCIVYGPDTGRYRAASRGRHRRSGPAGHDGRRRQRRPPGPQRSEPRACCASPTLRCPTSAAQCPGGVYPREPGPALDVLQGTAVPVRHRQGSRPAAATPSAATSATPPSSGSNASGQPEPGRGSVPGTTRRGPRQESRCLQPVRPGVRPRRHAVLRRHPHRVQGTAHRLRTGRLRRPGHAGQRSPNGQPSPPVTVATRVRLPDQRHGLRSGENAVSLSVGEDRGARCRALREPGAGRRAIARQAAHRRFRLTDPGATRGKRKPTRAARQARRGAGSHCEGSFSASVVAAGAV